MATTFRWVIAAALTVHGLIHLLGAAKGFGLADVSQLTKPIGPWGGGPWLLAAVLVLTAAVLLAVETPNWWWAIALAAAVVSQVAIATSWSDARAGTIVNIILVVAAVYGFAAEGGWNSAPAQWRFGMSRQDSHRVT